jgi:hypothetical protein
MYAASMEERLRGEPGYAGWVLYLTENGICSCDGCGGHLEEGRCISCGCWHFVQDASTFNRRGAGRVPVYESGRCVDADRGRAESQREHERQERRREAAEELGDPRR